MKIFTFRTVWGQALRAHAKFHRDQLNGCRVIPSFRFQIWRPSAILIFVRMRGTTSKVALLVFITVQNLDEIGRVVLIISKFKNFCDLAGNCLFTPPFGGFLGHISPKGHHQLS